MKKFQQYSFLFSYFRKQIVYYLLALIKFKRCRCGTAENNCLIHKPLLIYLKPLTPTSNFNKNNKLFIQCLYTSKCTEKNILH